MQNSKRESTGNGTVPLSGDAFSPAVTESGGASGTRLGTPQGTRRKSRTARTPPIQKPGQAPHRAAGTFPGVTTTYEPGYEKPSASPRESYWTC